MGRQFIRYVQGEQTVCSMLIVHAHMQVGSVRQCEPAQLPLTYPLQPHHTQVSHAHPHSRMRAAAFNIMSKANSGSTLALLSLPTMCPVPGGPFQNLVPSLSSLLPHISIQGRYWPCHNHVDKVRQARGHGKRGLHSHTACSGTHMDAQSSAHSPPQPSPALMHTTLSPALAP